MALEFSTSHLHDSLAIFRQYKRLADRAMEQVSDEQLARAIDAETDSIAQIVKHVAGNMRSRWTDFLTTDGEKPDRNRDSEFEDPPVTRAELMRMWNEGWALLFAALEPLGEADLGRTVMIRGEAHSVMQAINRQITHYAYHVGQIVLIAKYFSGSGWKSLTVPRGKSDEFLRKVLKGEASQR
jgi:chromosome segregation and condensation protein ScpB